MIRVVVDTNVVVSALMSRHGAPAQALSLIYRGSEFQPCISAELFAEYEEVLRRPKLRRSEEQIEEILNGVRRGALWVRPVDDVKICTDSDDDMVLACAQAAGAQYVITGNWRHFPVEWRGARIVNAREFLDMFD